MKKPEEKDQIAYSSLFTVDGPIPYGRQHITEEDIQAVVDVLRSDNLTQGPKITEFEEVFAEYVGAKYAIAVSNGTSALHLCNMILSVKPGDKVITTPITFAATANSVLYCGGEVVFSDIDPNTYLLDIRKVRELLESSPKGTYKGIIPVDFAGRAVNLEAFRNLADEYGLWIIEDACHAPGGYFLDSNDQKQYCGNGNNADLAIFSFHPVKHIAAGEGGMITTNDEEMYQKLLKLRTHGITKNESEYQNSIEIAVGKTQNPKFKSQSYPTWYMEMQSLGFNYRLTDFQAALGISQLKRAEESIQKRRELAAHYAEAFKNIPQITDRNLEVSSTQNGHAYHLYVIEVKDRLGLYNYLRNNNIYSQIHYIPLHLMPYYREYGWRHGDFKNAETYYNNCISIPMYPSLTFVEQELIINLIQKYYQ